MQAISGTRFDSKINQTNIQQTSNKQFSNLQLQSQPAQDTISFGSLFGILKPKVRVETPKDKAINLLAENAANWWGQLINIRNTPEIESNPGIGVKQILTFTDELKKGIQKGLKNQPRYYKLNVDYNPDITISSAMKKAGIPDTMREFPFKTYMSIIDGEITTSMHHEQQKVFELSDELKKALI